ncbi:MAG: bifunctional phosphoribosyl-AMP cyclohydrolase/phosphoribosyl-ATP diphosphatase HisIE [Syntrophomonadaceae bacterium]|jgi:phosphoribosyl-ATP pyrophosphohydrolase/phosphoribosyl-AMP cyclohydrolase|nr:bifunctional phosphoribosyl-AMP cyclohydrolase/phosphoribosyl-ATP diphosphatase HisIE [Syntrophomonadaceae bacterium]
MLGIELKYDEKGLIPAIVQDHTNGQVLMMAYMDEESLKRTLESGKTWFYSRGRQEYWLKGETSGNVQTVKDIRYDCDADTLLVLVEQKGAACHTGHYSCFYRDQAGREVEPPVFERQTAAGTENYSILSELRAVISQRKVNPPEGSYTGYLFEKGLDKILKKVGEETAEVIIAAKNPDPGELVYETADLLYHLLVLLEEKQVDLSLIMRELQNRR